MSRRSRNKIAAREDSQRKEASTCCCGQLACSVAPTILVLAELHAAQHMPALVIHIHRCPAHCHYWKYSRGRVSAQFVTASRAHLIDLCSRRCGDRGQPMRERPQKREKMPQLREWPQKRSRRGQRQSVRRRIRRRRQSWLLPVARRVLD